MLRQQLDATTRRAESLRQVIESISGELALAPLLDRILESAVELLAAQHGAIGLVIETSAGPAIRIAAIFNMPPQELGAEHPAGVGLAGHVLRDQRVIQIERYADLGAGSPPELAGHAMIGRSPTRWRSVRKLSASTSAICSARLAFRAARRPRSTPPGSASRRRAIDDIDIAPAPL